MAFLNARYYDGARGQFLSQDPTFLAIGDVKKVKELTQQELNQILMDPQTLNSYSYARNNPIINKDPSGNWYVEISGGPDIIFAGISGGIRFDNKGAEGFLALSGGLMASLPIQASFSSGDLTHKPRLAVSRNAELAAIAGAGISREGDFDKSKPLSLGKNQQNSYSIIAGAGGEFSQTYTASRPISTPSTKDKNNGSNSPRNTHELTVAGPKVNIKQAQSHVSRFRDFISQQFNLK